MAYSRWHRGRQAGRQGARSSRQRRGLISNCELRISNSSRIPLRLLRTFPTQPPLAQSRVKGDVARHGYLERCAAQGAGRGIGVPSVEWTGERL